MNAFDLVGALEGEPFEDIAEVVVKVGTGRPIPVESIAFDEARNCFVITIELELVSTSDIARRVRKSKATVLAWSRGTRGPGGFPAPYKAGGEWRETVWAWRDVEAWLTQWGRWPPNGAEPAGGSSP